MKKLMNKKGFTLIELMIVVVIIGILAAIAIPNFLRYQLKSKHSEASRNLGAMHTNEEAFGAKFGTYATAGAVGSGSTSKLAWPTPPKDPATYVGFDALGFRPSGGVYFLYDAGGASAGNTGFTSDANGRLILSNAGPIVRAGMVDLDMHASGDLDGDTTVGTYTINDENNEAVPTPVTFGEAVF